MCENRTYSWGITENVRTTLWSNRYPRQQDQPSVHRCSEGLVQGRNAEVWLAAYSRAEESVWNHLDNFLQQRGGRNKRNIPVLKVTNKVIYWRQCWIYVWEENMWIKCFPWETKKFTLVWQWSIYMFPWFQCACSPLLLPFLLLAAVLKFALPSLTLPFHPFFPSLSPEENKRNWIFITELKLFHFYTEEISTAVFDYPSFCRLCDSWDIFDVRNTTLFMHTSSPESLFQHSSALCL